jgi:hypothetical protein
MSAFGWKRTSDLNGARLLSVRPPAFKPILSDFAGESDMAKEVQIISEPEPDGQHRVRAQLYGCGPPAVAAAQLPYDYKLDQQFDDRTNQPWNRTLLRCHTEGICFTLFAGRLA